MCGIYELPLVYASTASSDEVEKEAEILNPFYPQEIKYPDNIGKMGRVDAIKLVRQWCADRKISCSLYQAKTIVDAYREGKKYSEVREIIFAESP